MPTYKDVPDRKRAIRKARKRLRRRSPCGRPPIAPTGLVGSFDRAESGRHQRIRANVRWTEVNTDTQGFKMRVRNYVVELEYTANGSDWFDARRATVSAKKDDDPGTKDHHKFKNIQKNLGYRWRVRAVAHDGCKGEWSSYHVLGNPGTDEPPAPSSVRIIDKDAHLRVTMRWDATAAPDDNDLFDDKINHFVAEISKAQNFSTNYRKNRGVKGNHVSFRIDEADKGDTFYGRVRSVSADKDKSAWIPARIAGNSDPGANAEGVTVGENLNKSKAPKVPQNVILVYQNPEKKRTGRWRLRVRWEEVTQDVDSGALEIDKYVVNLQMSTDGSTWTDDPRRVVVQAKDEDADTHAHFLFNRINDKRWYRARVRAISHTNTRGAWSAWTGGARPDQTAPPGPTNVTIRHRPKAKDRVVIDWDAPTDSEDSDLITDDIQYFQVIIKTTSTSPSFATAYKQDKLHVATKKTFQIPAAMEDSTFYGWVRSVDASKNKSAWIAATRGGNSSAVTTAEFIQTGDGVPAGTVRAKKTNVIPEGWLRANGQFVSTSAYPDLFAVIGYTYGNGGSLFGLPDLRRRRLTGVGSTDALGANEGDAESVRSDDHELHEATGTIDSVHTHNAGGLNTGGPSTSQFNIAAQGSQRLSTDTHTHQVQGDSGTQGSRHIHGKSVSDSNDILGQPLNKGHRRRPFSRVHWNIKAVN